MFSSVLQSIFPIYMYMYMCTCIHVWYLCWVDIIFKEIESALVVVGNHVPIPIPPDPILESAEFQVLSLDGKVWVFDTGCPEEAALWVKAIEEQIKKMYSENVSHKRMVGETVCLCVPVFVHVHVYNVHVSYNPTEL